VSSALASIQGGEEPLASKEILPSTVATNLQVACFFLFFVCKSIRGIDLEICEYKYVDILYTSGNIYSPKWVALMITMIQPT
jgi:hypothetical protein